MIANRDLAPDDPRTEDNTLLVGRDAWVRIRPTVYVVGETIPRLAGYLPSTNHITFDIEKRAGCHLFQFNVSNSLRTTVGQLTRGTRTNDDWLTGFNISRRFF